MTGRLIKYEFKSGIKILAAIWAALIASAVLISIMNSLMVRVFAGKGHSFFGTIMEIVPVMLYGALFLFLIFATIGIVILRFYKGILGDEGYLMNTLPVKPWQLITSKGMVASIFTMIGIIIAAISILIIGGMENYGHMFSNLKLLFAEMAKEPKWILFTVEALIIAVLSVLKSIYQVYAALSIGQLTDKHRILCSVGAYIGISIVLIILAVLLVNAGDAVGIIEWFGKLLQNSSQIAEGQLIFLGLLILTGVQLAAFHIISERIISLKLNLL